MGFKSGKDWNGNRKGRPPGVLYAFTEQKMALVAAWKKAGGVKIWLKDLKSDKPEIRRMAYDFFAKMSPRDMNLDAHVEQVTEMSVEEQVLLKELINLAKQRMTQ